MFRKGKFSVRTQFRLIALSLYLMTTILGMSAYLTTKKQYEARFYVVKSGNFEIELTGTSYDIFTQTVIPGQTLDFNLSAKNNSSIDMYLFMNISMDEYVFQKNLIQEELSHNGWNQFDYGNDYYYYGYQQKLVPVTPEGDDSKVNLFERLTINPDIYGENNYIHDVDVTLYAVQKIGLEHEQYYDYVWELVKDKFVGNNY